MEQKKVHMFEKWKENRTEKQKCTIEDMKCKMVQQENKIVHSKCWKKMVQKESKMVMGQKEHKVVEIVSCSSMLVHSEYCMFVEHKMEQYSVHCSEEVVLNKTEVVGFDFEDKEKVHNLVVEDMDLEVRSTKQGMQMVEDKEIACCNMVADK